MSLLLLLAGADGGAAAPTHGGPKDGWGVRQSRMQIIPEEEKADDDEWLIWWD